jgi:hypothetical protein
MSELSAIGKIKRALKLAKQAEVGMTLTYFDVIELLREIEWLEEANRKLFEMHDGAIISELRRGLELQYADNAELNRKLAEAEQKQREAESMVERLIEAGERLRDYAILVSADHPTGDGQMALINKSVWDALTAECKKEIETC